MGIEMKNILHRLRLALPQPLKARIRKLYDWTGSRLRYHRLIEEYLSLNMPQEQLQQLEYDVNAGKRRHLAAKKARHRFEKLDGLKLELGGGNERREGWLNIDLHADEGGLRLDLRQPLPFPDLSVEYIYSSHLLEHFRYPNPMTNLLRECFRVLQVGGVFSAAVPDVGRALRSYVAGDSEFYKQKFWGDPEPNWCRSPMDALNWLIYMGDEHHFFFDERNLVARLEEVGFDKVRIRDYDESLDNPARRHQSLYVEAIKTQIDPLGIDQFTLCRSNRIEDYDRLWQDRALTLRYAVPDRIAFWREIAQYIEQVVEKSALVLDIGCGGGHLLELLNKEFGFKANKLYGVDYSLKATEQARSRLATDNFCRMDASMLAFASNLFDIVICCELLEHVSDPARTMAEAYRILSPNGFLMITIPDGKIDTFEGHIHFWTEKQFRKFCAAYPLVHFEKVDKERTFLFVFQKNASTDAL